MPAEFLRFHSAVPNRHGRFPGLFALANGLQADGRLSEEEERWWRENNELGHRLYPDPSSTHPDTYDRTKHPGAQAWFKAEVVHIIAYARGYTRLLDAHQVPWTLLTTTTPGRIIYEDDVQVVALPFSYADDWPFAPPAPAEG